MIDKQIKYELDFFYSNEVIPLPGHMNSINWYPSIKKIEECIKNNKKFTLYHYHETFGHHESLMSIQNMLKDCGVEYYFSSSTSEILDNFFHPLTSLAIHWGNSFSRKDIRWQSDNDTIKMFDFSIYNTFEKSIPYILSVRKMTEARQKLFQKLNKSNNTYNGIVRYASWSDSGDDDVLTFSNFPTYKELADEYKSSYISFVIETEGSPNQLSFTEKTILSFISKSIPIVFGGKNYSKSLEKLGFWTGNILFNIEDDYEIFEDIKIDSLIDKINEVNKLNIDDVKRIYQENLEHIENNFKIVKELFSLNEKYLQKII